MGIIRKEQIIATKLVIESYTIAGINPAEHIAESLDFLYSNYKRTNDEKCMNAIISLVLACKELGVLFNGTSDRIRDILNMKDFSSEDFGVRGTIAGRIVRNNTSEIRAVLGYWPQDSDAVWNGEKVAKDIREKINLKRTGQYVYSKNADKSMIILNIYPKVAYLVNTEKKRIYTFLIEGEDIDD